MEHHESKHEKTKAALSSVLWSALLTGLKFAVGITTGSLGLISEALHSGLDFIAAAVTLYAVRVASRPADDDHPYGHGKVENLSALGETLLLIITAVWVIQEAISRLVTGDIEINPTIWAFAVIIISLVVDVNRSAMLYRVARKHNSQALEADAAHFSTDIWSSAAVLLGLICVSCAQFVPEGSFWHDALLRADIIAALAVAFLILHVSYDLGKRAINALMDGGTSTKTAEIRERLRERMPTYPVTRLRVRESGNKTYVEMEICAPKDLHVDTAHDISNAIENIVTDMYPEAEVLVHVEPGDGDCPLSRELMVRHIALSHRFSVHGYALACTPEQGDVLFLDVELPPDLKLSQTLVAVRAFETDVRNRLGIARIVSHIEPDSRDFRTRTPLDLPSEAVIRETVSEIFRLHPEAEFRTWEILTSQDAPILLITAGISEAQNVHDSHVLLKRMEDELKREMPAFGKISIALANG